MLVSNRNSGLNSAYVILFLFFLKVIVRNMLLEMLIDLQMTIRADDVLDTWHKIVSSKLITFLLDEAVHPTSMRWVMTLLGVCLAPSPTFAARFKSSGGFQALAHVLPSFYDCPEIYYVLFSIIFGRPVYPRQPEVTLLDFQTLIPRRGNKSELFFTELLESIVAMSKAAFNQIIVQSESTQQTGDFSGFYGTLAANSTAADSGETLQGDAFFHKTYAARLIGGEVAAPAMVASLLRFMVDVTKACHPFSVACCRTDFLESCIDLYFTCVRSAAAIQAAQGLVSGPLDEYPGENSIASEEPLPPPIISFSQQKRERLNVSQLRVETDFPVETSAPLVLVTDDFDEVWAAASPSEKPLSPPSVRGTPPTGLSIEIPISPTPSDMSSITFLTPKPPGLGSPIGSWLTDSLSLNFSEMRQPKSTLSPPPTPPRSTKSRVRHRSFSAFSSLSASQATTDFDFNFGDFGPLSSTSVAASETPLFPPVSVQLLLQIEALGGTAGGGGGGPCVLAASAVLDLIAEVLADSLTEQAKSTSMVEAVLEAVPLYVSSDATLVFQGLCLRRMMNKIVRILTGDAAEHCRKHEKHKWATNLDTLSWLLVDRVYMGAFMEPPGALCVLEFLLAVLQLANMDQRVEDATPAAKSLLFTRATGRQVEAYVQALLKNTNRMLMFCFLPVANSNNNSDQCTKDEFITPTQKNNDYLILSKESTFTDVTDQNLVEGDSGYTRGGVGGGLDKAVVLRLLLANQKLILCGSNVDPELMSTLCVNLFHMVWDNEQSIRTLAIDVWKVLLKLRVPALEEILISHGMQVHSFVCLSLYPNKPKWSKDSREYKKKLLCLSSTSF
jgi:hypothetical protein